MIKTSNIAPAIFLLILMACREDNAPIPNYSEIVKNSEWFGLYQNTGETFKRAYALTINLDSTFSFYADGFTHDGAWTIVDKTIHFKFLHGSKNHWSAEIGNDTLKQISVPSPPNFFFIGTSKKIESPVSDVVGHIWKQKATGSVVPYSLVLGPSAMSFTKTGSAGLNMEYSSAPYKDKIYRSTPHHQLLVIDGKKLWSTIDSYDWVEFQY